MRQTTQQNGYDLDKMQVSLNDISMFLSFISKLRDKAQQVYFV